jgi:outer membrane protein assembly factor BamB
MKELRKILSLILVFTFCVIPMNAFASSIDGKLSVEGVEEVSVKGKVIKLQNATTGETEWFIKDKDGNQDKIEGYLPGMTAAFNDYLKIEGGISDGEVYVSGTRVVYPNAPIKVKEITCNRYMCSVEKVISGELSSKYIDKEKKFKYVVTSLYDNEEYVIDDNNNLLNNSLIGKNVVVSGSMYPNPNFRIGHLYE